MAILRLIASVNSWFLEHHLLFYRQRQSQCRLHCSDISTNHVSSSTCSLQPSIFHPSARFDTRICSPRSKRQLLSDAEGGNLGKTPGLRWNNIGLSRNDTCEKPTDIVQLNMDGNSFRVAVPSVTDRDRNRNGRINQGLAPDIRGSTPVKMWDWRCNALRLQFAALCLGGNRNAMMSGIQDRSSPTNGAAD